MLISPFIPTPILNKPNFEQVFGKNNIEHDEKGHIRALEFIALPGTIFYVLDIIIHQSSTIYQVSSSDYPSQQLFLDHRFVKKLSSHQKGREKPSKEKIYLKLLSLKGSPYLWGGNWSQGINQLLDYYPPKTLLDSKKKQLRTLQGVDCSGLLYEATNGFSPRNTSLLMHFGHFLPIPTYSYKDLLKNLQFLDLILFPGHVIIVLDNRFVIESREKKGVVVSSTSKRCSEIIKKHTPSGCFLKNTDNFFVIKRCSGLFK